MDIIKLLERSALVLEYCSHCKVVVLLLKSNSQCMSTSIDFMVSGCGRSNLLECTFAQYVCMRFLSIEGRHIEED